MSIIAALFMWAAVIWWIFIWWNWATSVLTWVLNFLATLMIETADTVAALPLATIEFKPNVLQVIGIYSMGILAFYYFCYRRMSYGIAASLALLSVICFHFI